VVVAEANARREQVLTCSGVTKRFGGLEAVCELDLRVERGQIFGIAGPNGAGKTTLFNLISGHLPVTGGTVRFDDRDVTTLAADARFRLGLARTFQAPLVFASESVLDNAVVGAHYGRSHPALSLRWRSGHVAEARAALETVGLADRAYESAAALSLFDRKRLMIASALARDPIVLMLDEPFGGLSPGEIDALVEIVRAINLRGVSIVVIEHVLKALFALAERVLVMHDGKGIFQGPTAEVVRDEAVIRSYLGAAIDGATP
jgi:ABC-type branched-subunit amino acid transport system ATPase component